MPRNISFSMTTKQVRAKAKTVTRRFGWWFLKPGDILQPIEKGMGLKKGERVKKINGPIKVVSTRGEPLCEIDEADCVKEGFPDLSPHEFVGMLQAHYGCAVDEKVNRIEFEYLDGKMEKELLHILQHSLGVDQYGQGKQYRNHFATDPCGKDFHLCQQLAKIGLMKDLGPRKILGGMHCFVVTPNGIDAVALESPPPPKISRSKKRYQEYLESDDCFENFREFLRYDTGRRKGLCS